MTRFWYKCTIKAKKNKSLWKQIKPKCLNKTDSQNQVRSNMYEGGELS